MFIDRHPIKFNATSVFDHPLHDRRYLDDLIATSLDAQRERSEKYPQMNFLFENAFPLCG